jgi:hypothetical protein
VVPDTTPAVNGTPVADSADHAAAQSGQGTVARAPSAAAAKSASKVRQRAKKAARKNASSKPAKSGEGTIARAAGSASEVGADDRLAVGHPDLDAEVRLVDDMHRAVRRNDDEALRRYIERYRMTFPDGQLGKEVAEFAARLAASKTSESDETPPD